MQISSTPDRGLTASLATPKSSAAPKTSAMQQPRVQRLLAEYLRMWGLRDPQVIAAQCQAWNDDSEAIGSRSTPADQRQRMMQRAMRDMNRWVDGVAATCVDADEVASRRGLLAMELQSTIDRYPQTLLTGQLPPAMVDQLHSVARPVVPKVCPTPMPSQDLGELSSPFCLQWWSQLAGGCLTTTWRLISMQRLSPRQFMTEVHSAAHVARIVLAILTALTTACGAWMFGEALAARGAGNWSLVLLPLFVVLFLWVALSFWIATAGFCRRLRAKADSCGPPADPAACTPVTTRTAILMPVYNESPHRVFAGLRAIYESIRATGDGAAFDFFILSDTTDPDIWLAEELAWARLNQAVTGTSRVYYRHRTKNVGRKAGNIADFCERWGALYRYMIVLDADSIMSGETICEMVCRMEQDDRIGILQVPPVPVNRASLFARCQQFAARVYGPTFLEGFAWWSGSDGNYWGHNAIIRVEAFTRCCGLPKLPGNGPLGGEILSHDFVEAALMRRAGYKVCLAHDLEGSYEECPPTLIDFAQRDQRWCQGNMQHIRLVFTSALRPISRLHLGMGAMSYLSSPLWMLSLVLSFLSVALPHTAGTWPATEIPTNAVSPSAMHQWGGMLFAATMALLLLPKLWSYLLLLREPRRIADYGGPMKVAVSVLIETFVSILVAPIMMAFHSTFVVSTFLGRHVQWTAQQRGEQGQRFAAAFWAHWKQTLFGTVAAVATWLLAPEMFLWLIPIFAGLILSIPLSILLSSTVIGRWLAARGMLLIPEETVATKVLERHRHLLALAPAKESADPRGNFRRVVADPAFLALHRSILEATGAGVTIDRRPVQLIQRQLMSGGAARITKESRKAILSDAAALQALHLSAWTSRRE